MKSRHYRIWSFILAFVITLSSVNVNAFAGEADGLQNSNSGTGNVLDDETYYSDDTVGVGDNVIQGENNENEDVDPAFSALLEQLEGINNTSEGEEAVKDEVVEQPQDELVTPKEDQTILEYDGWNYYVDDENYAHIVALNDNTSSELQIPNTVNGYIVRTIEGEALTDIDNLSSITIPFYVTYIDSTALNEGIKIKAYHGSYAIEFAQNNGYEYENLSQYDFADRVHDFSQIIRTNYDFLANTDILLGKTEASLLTEGSVFFMPESIEIRNGDAFKVISMEDDGSMMLIHCERALGAEVLKSLQIDDMELLPDWSQAIIYDGVELVDSSNIANDCSDMIDSDEELLGTKISSGGGFKQNLKFSVGDVEGSLASDISATLSANIKFGFFNTKIEKFDLSLSTSSELSVSYKKEIKRVKSREKRLATVPLVSVGLAGINADVIVGWSVAGKATLKYATKTEKKLTLEGSGKFKPIEKNYSRSLTFSGSVEGKIYIKYELDSYVIGICSFRPGYEIGVKISISGDMSVSAQYGSSNEVANTNKITITGSVYWKFYLNAEPKGALKKAIKELTGVDIKAGYELEFAPKLIFSQDITKSPQSSISGSSGGGPLGGGADNQIDGGGGGADSDDENYDEWDEWDLSQESEEPPSNYDYIIENGGAIITSYYTYFGEEAPTEIIVPEKIMGYPVTEIGQCSFASHREIERIVLPDTVTTIGEQAFSECVKLKNIEMGPNIKSIGDKAFDWCYSLESIELCDGLEYIGQYAFRDCNNLKTIEIPGSVSEIGSSAFYECEKLENVHIGSGTYEMGKSPFFRCLNLKHINIEGNIKTIPEMFAQYCRNLQFIELPNSVENIGDSAFSNCYSLTQVKMGDNVSEIGKSAFIECTKLKTVELSKSLKTIGSGAFYDCVNLTNIYLPEGLKCINSGAFSNTGLKTVIIPKSIETFGSSIFGSTITLYVYKGSYAECLKDYYDLVLIGADSADLGKEATITYNYNDGSNNIVRAGIVGCQISEPISSGDDNKILVGWYRDKDFTYKWRFDKDVLPQEGITLYAKWYTAFGEYGDFVYDESDNGIRITGCSSNNSRISIPEQINGRKVTGISEKALDEAENIESLVIPKYINNIDYTAFDNLGKLSSISVDNGNAVYKSIDGVLFNYDGTKLLSVPRNKKGTEYVVPDSVVSIEQGAFRGCSFSQIVLCDSLRSIGDKAFYECRNLSSISLPDNVSTIGKEIVTHGYTKLYGVPDNEYYTNYAESENIDYNIYSIKGVINDEDEENEWYIECQAGKNIKSEAKTAIFDVDAVGSRICGYCMENSENLIDWDSFVMPDRDLTVYAVWENDFRYSHNADDSITILGLNVSSTDPVIPDTIDGCPVTSIDSGAFADSKIASVTVPYSVKQINNGAIAKSVVIVCDDDSYAKKYSDTNGYSTKTRRYAVTFESNGGSAVSAYYYKKGDKITSRVTQKDNYTFAGWYADENLSSEWNFSSDTMPGNPVTLYAKWIIDDSSISDCEFTYIIEDGYIVITGYNGDSENIRIPDSINGVDVKIIGEGAFRDNKTLKRIVISSGITSIESNAFNGCTSLNDLYLPMTISNLGDFAVANCVALEDIDLKYNQITNISEGCFNGCVKLKYVVLPYALKKISAGAFYNCRRVTDYEIPNTVECIEEYAFGGNRSLTSITIPNSVTSIDSFFVDECPKLESINVENGNSTYKSIDGILYKNNELVRCPGGKSGIISIDNSINSIGEYAFKNCYKITGVNLPDSITCIKIGTFSECESLSEITLPTGVKSLENMSFSFCNSLRKLYLGNNVTGIKDDAFLGTNVTIQCEKGSYVESYGRKNGIGIIYNEIYVDSASIIVGDGFGLNFFVSIPNPEGKKVRIEGVTYDLPTPNNDGTYKFTYKVYAKMIADKINLAVVDDTDGDICSFEYSVEDYVQSVIDNSQDYNFRLVALCRAISQYGNCARNYFGYNATGSTQDVAVRTIDGHERVCGGMLPEGLNYKGMSLVLKDQTSIRHYFEGDISGISSVTVEGKEVQLKKSAENLYYIEISNLVASELDTIFEIVVASNAGYYYVKSSALSYCDAARKRGDADLVNLVNSAVNLNYYSDRYVEYYGIRKF